MSTVRSVRARRQACIDAARPGPPHREQPDVEGLLATLAATPEALSWEAVCVAAALHGLSAAALDRRSGDGGRELVLLLPPEGACDAREHWLLALWRDDAGRLSRAALFACTSCWQGPGEDA